MNTCHICFENFATPEDNYLCPTCLNLTTPLQQHISTTNIIKQITTHTLKLFSQHPNYHSETLPHRIPYPSNILIGLDTTNLPTIYIEIANAIPNAPTLHQLLHHNLKSYLPHFHNIYINSSY